MLTAEPVEETEMFNVFVTTTDPKQAAAIANAGAVTWNLLNLTASPDTTDKSAATYTAYLFIGTDIATKTALLDEGKFDDFTSAAAKSATSTYVAASQMINIMGAAYGDFKSETVSAYAIVLNAANAADATYYLVAKGGTGTTGTVGEEVITKTFGTTGNQAFGWGQQNTNTSWTAVPEPTSGLLMLLGVAGLALKRKRA